MIILRIFLIFVIVMGILQIVNPEKSFMRGRRWMFEDDNSKMSDCGIDFTRIMAIIFTILSLCILLYSFFAK